MSQIDAISELITVDVKPYYIEEREVDDAPLFVFGYEVTIRNNSDVPVQLLNRHWYITDGDGKQSEVKGEGVVGLQPVIEPMSEFQYSSGSNFRTPVGTMHGQYEMQCQQLESQLFHVDISPFLLANNTVIH
ncbi:MAG: Co2+/Mg2+ efflux protein ApaG [Psychrobium sp.]